MPPTNPGLHKRRPSQSRLGRERGKPAGEGLQIKPKMTTQTDTNKTDHAGTLSLSLTGVRNLDAGPNPRSRAKDMVTRLATVSKP